MRSHVCRACLCILNTTEEIISIFDVYKNIYYLPVMIPDIFKVKIDFNDELTKNVCRICADKIVDFHQFYLMYLESDKKLRDHLVNDEVDNDEIKLEDCPVEGLFIETTTIETIPKEEHKNVEEIFIEEIKYDKRSKFECPICLDEFRSKRSLTKHSNTCIKPTTSTTGQDQTPEIDYQLIIGSTNDEIETDIEHFERLSKHANDESEQIDCLCQNCQEKFNTVELLMEHQQTCSLEIKIEKSIAKAKNPDANGNWICERCGEAHPSKIALREHRKMHREPKKYTENEETGEYICDVCTKSFDTKEKIQFHVRRHGDIKCLCNVCGKWLSCRDNLNKHYRAVHLNEKKHVCPICSHRFTSSFRLKDHVNSHKGIRAYSCEICPTRFFNCSAVKRHMDTVHSDEKKFVCNVCSKAFKLPTNLKTHMFAHTGIYEHTCEHCGTGFRRKNKMMQHIQEMHGITTS